MLSVIVAAGGSGRSRGCAAPNMSPKAVVPNATAVSALLLALACHGAALAQDRRSTPAEPRAMPKAILLIGDGMDQTQITIARYYLAGHDGRLTLDTLPERSSVQTQTVLEEDPRLPEYVPDSANTASSMASGIVTSTGRIATTAGTDRDAPTVMELAAAAGFGTGIVATSSVTDATPASFVAHVSYRLCESPRAWSPATQNNPAFSTDCSADLKANGGKGSIAEQIAASRVDVVLGGGERNFAQPAEGETTRTVRDLAVANGYRVIGTGAELARSRAAARCSGYSRPARCPCNGAAPATRRPSAFSAGTTGASCSRCRSLASRIRSSAPRPRWTAMTRAALNHLDGRPFVLMVESASIDKQSHVRRPCGQIGELKQLDDTLKIVLEYARAHPETLVLVTADHGQAAQLVPETSWLAGLNAASPGHFARLRTPEGGLLGVNYATNDSNLQEDHTGTDVPLFAYGAGAEDIPAALRQTDVFHLLMKHLGLRPPSPP